MSAKANTIKSKLTGSSSSTIPRNEWGQFLEAFQRQHRGWLTSVETIDSETKERAVSHEMPLQAIELDLEDERNPRINVSVKLDNKILKHVLFRPSRVILRTSGPNGDESLEVGTANTDTRVHFRPPDSSFPVI